MKLVIGSVAFVVVALIALVIFMSSENARKEREAQERAAKETAAKAEAAAQMERAQAEAAAMAEEQAAREKAAAEAEAADAEKPKEVDPTNVREELSEGDMRGIPIPEGKTGYMAHQAEIKTYEWPDHVTAEERNKIEEAITHLLDHGGRDAAEAEEYLVALDRDTEDGAQFKAVGRLISEFKNRLDKEDFSIPLTMSKFMTLDRTLRKIDGVMERDFKNPKLNIASSEGDVRRTAKFWNWWYDLEKWRMRREPWDERLDTRDRDLGGEGEDG